MTGGTENLCEFAAAQSGQSQPAHCRQELLKQIESGPRAPSPHTAL